MAATKAGEAAPVLRGEGLRLSFGSPVLAGVDLRLEPGQSLLVAGRNGAGKSTLMRILAGVQVPDAGTVWLGDRVLAEVDPRERARTVAMVPQEIDCPFEFTAVQYAAMGRYPHLRRFRGPTSADMDAVRRALVLVDATAYADRPVTTLSGGELRRVALARALATEAQVLLLDEPTANLDLEHALALLDLLGRLTGEGRSVLVASHDLNLVGSRVAAVALLHGGQVVASGTPAEVLGWDAIREVFGVDGADPTGYFPRDFRSLAGQPVIDRRETPRARE